MEESKTWGGKREGSGRPKGARNKTPAGGRKTLFKSKSVTGYPEEIAELEKMAEASGKPFSRFVIEALLKK